MSIVTFQNPGLIEIEAVTTLGVNVKEADNPIGFFGTGLKYAIAGILRTGQRITIYRGLERFDFKTQEIEVRGKPFNFIFMNGQKLGFTTDLGKTWETWQLFRELYSNVLDEQGSMTMREVKPENGLTTIHIWGEAFFTAATKKDEIFLSTLYKTSTYAVELHEGVTCSVFYRGIKVHELEKPSLFTYNLKEAQTLTEDRTLKSAYALPHYMASVIMESDAKTIREAVSRQDFAEWELRYSSLSVNKLFAETVMEVANLTGFCGVAPGALTAAEEFMHTKAEVKKAKVTLYEQKQIDQAISFLSKIGFEIDQPVFVAVNLGKGVAGQARDGIIYLTKDTLDKGGNFLIGTILEEHLHLSKGFFDETREFQNYLLDLAIKFAKQAVEG